MFTPIKRTKRNARLLDDIDKFIGENISILHIKPVDYALLLESIEKSIRNKYLTTIPYKGLCLIKL